jgi:hypothetical protein
VEEDWGRELADPDVPEARPPLKTHPHLIRTDTFLEAGCEFRDMVEDLARTDCDERNVESTYAFPKQNEVQYTGCLAVAVKARNLLCRDITRAYGEICGSRIVAVVKFANDISSLYDTHEVSQLPDSAIASTIPALRSAVTSLRSLATSACEELATLIRHHAWIVIASIPLPTFDVALIKERSTLHQSVTDDFDEYNQFVNRCAAQHQSEPFQLPTRRLQTAIKLLRGVEDKIALGDDRWIRDAVSDVIAQVQAILDPPQELCVDAYQGRACIRDAKTGKVTLLEDVGMLETEIQEALKHRSANCGDFNIVIDHPLNLGEAVDNVESQPRQPSHRRPTRRRRTERVDRPEEERASPEDAEPLTRILDKAQSVGRETLNAGINHEITAAAPSMLPEVQDPKKKTRRRCGKRSRRRR